MSSSADAIAATVTPAEAFEARLDDRLADLRWAYEQRWEEADLGPLVREWLREVLRTAVIGMRQDLCAVARDVLVSAR